MAMVARDQFFYFQLSSKGKKEYSHKQQDDEQIKINIKKIYLPRDASSTPVVIELETMNGATGESVKLELPVLEKGKNDRETLEIFLDAEDTTIRLIEGDGPVNVIGSLINEVDADYDQMEGDDDEEDEDAALKKLVGAASAGDSDDDDEEDDDEMEEDESEEEEDLRKKLAKTKAGEKRKNGVPEKQPAKKVAKLETNGKGKDESSDEDEEDYEEEKKAKSKDKKKPAQQPAKGKAGKQK